MTETDSFAVIAIGDSTQDIFLAMSDASVQCDLDGHNCRICFDYAEKIGVDQKDVVSAVGNAANHAIGVARLGLRSAIYTVIGDDDEGHKAKEIFEAEKVDVQYIDFDKEHDTNLSVVINFKGERTIFVYHEPRTYTLPELALSKWIYLTSVSGGGVEPLHAQVLQYLEKNATVKLAFNPGTYQIKLGLAKLKPLLARTALLFLNREESARVLGQETRDIKELMKGFFALGVKAMVITDGPEGAYASDGKDIWYQGIYKGEVVERTGTGDAYGSGTLGGMLHGKALPEAMCWGNANATSVVGYIGAREGLLTVDRVEQMIKDNSTILPTPYGTIGN
jgi:sugar/nucleoside kinase (ribokinase family)